MNSFLLIFQIIDLKNKKIYYNLIDIDFKLKIMNFIL